MYLSLCQNIELHFMNKEKIQQRLYNLLEDAYRKFYHIVFLEVTKTYGVIPNGLKIKKDACIGNVSKNFVASWDLQLFKAEIQLMKILILEHIRKLFAIEEHFNSLFKHHTVQEDWLFQTRNHLEKLEKAERWRKLKKLCKLSNNETLSGKVRNFVFKCLERFESHFEFFLFKFVPDFENYLLHLNTSESIKDSSSEKSELKQYCSKNSCKNACMEIGNRTSNLTNSKNIEEEINANGNQAILLENRLKGNFVSKNVVN